jgi:hypothetical protein
MNPVRTGPSAACSDLTKHFGQHGFDKFILPDLRLSAPGPFHSDFSSSGTSTTATPCSHSPTQGADLSETQSGSRSAGIIRLLRP